MSKECIHNQCADYYYANGLCMNKQNKDKHFKECEADECDYKEMSALSDTDAEEG